MRRRRRRGGSSGFIDRGAGAREGRSRRRRGGEAERRRRAEEAGTEGGGGRRRKPPAFPWPGELVCQAERARSSSHWLGPAGCLLPVSPKSQAIITRGARRHVRQQTRGGGCAAVAPRKVLPARRATTHSDLAAWRAGVLASWRPGVLASWRPVLSWPRHNGALVSFIPWVAALEATAAAGRGGVACTHNYDWMPPRAVPAELVLSVSGRLCCAGRCRWTATGASFACTGTLSSCSPRRTNQTAKFRMQVPPSGSSAARARQCLHRLIAYRPAPPH